MKNTGIKLNYVTTTDAIMRKNPITNGSLYYTTDKQEIFLDIDNKRVNFNAVVYGNTFNELMALGSDGNENKIFWEHENNCGYMWINNTLTKVFVPYNNIVNAMKESFKVEYVTSLDSITSPKDNVIYMVEYTNEDGSSDTVGYEAYTYNTTSASFTKFSHNHDEIKNIADKSVNNGLIALETELASIRDTLVTETSDDPTSKYAEIQSYYQNVYTKNQTYTSAEVDALINTETSRTNALVDSTVKTFQKTITPVVLTGEGSTSSLTPTINKTTYVLDMQANNVINIDVTNLLTNIASTENVVITLELLLKNCDKSTPLFNPVPTWVDNITPTYNNSNVLVGLKSYDKGNSWVGFYQGSW